MGDWAVCCEVGEVATWRHMVVQQLRSLHVPARIIHLGQAIRAGEKFWWQLPSRKHSTLLPRQQAFVTLRRPAHAVARRAAPPHGQEPQPRVGTKNLRRRGVLVRARACILCVDGGASARAEVAPAPSCGACRRRTRAKALQSSSRCASPAVAVASERHGR